MSIGCTDILVCYLTVFVNDEDRCRSQSVAVQIEDRISFRHLVVSGRVENRKVDSNLLSYGICAREVVGADGEDFGPKILDAVVASLQLT